MQLLPGAKGQAWV